MKRLILLLLLCVPPTLAQDVTCNSGDVAWVVDTENADEGIAGGGATAEYGNTSAPWGIQAVFDESCAGLDIRIVVGANNYNSGSTSWNNRDADKTIDIDTVAGTETDPIRVTGYASLGGAKALATLDFDSASGTFAQGFLISSVGDLHTFEYIRITDTDDDGIDNSGFMSVFARIEIDNAGVHGLDNNDNLSTGAFSSFHDNSNNGVDTGQSAAWIGNELYANGGDGGRFGATCVVGNLIYGNTDDGVEMFDGTIFAFNTIRDNGDDGIAGDGNDEGLVVWGNIITGHNGAGDVGLRTVSGDYTHFIADNNYGDNTTARTLDGGIAFDDDSTPDTTTCTFTSGTDHELLTNCTFSFTFPRATTGPTTFNKGAVQTHGAGGVTTIINTQGVAF